MTHDSVKYRLCRSSCLLLVLLSTGVAWTEESAGGVLRNPFFAMCTGTADVHHKTFASQADMVKELGFAGTDLLGVKGVPELLGELDKRGLKFFAIYNPVNIDADSPRWRPELDDAMETLKGRGVVVWTPLISRKYGVSAQEGDPKAVKTVQALADRAADYDLAVVLYPHSGFWLERVEDAVRIVKKVNRPNVSVTFNLSHWLMVDGKDLRTRLELARPYLAMVTINGADVGGKSWGRLIQPLDRGTFDTYSLLSILRELDYEGPIGLQGYGMGGDVHDNLQRSMAAWKDLLERLGEQE